MPAVISLAPGKGETLTGEGKKAILNLQIRELTDENDMKKILEELGILHLKDERVLAMRHIRFLKI